jgi:hypothetical protein
MIVQKRGRGRPRKDSYPSTPPDKVTIISLDGDKPKAIPKKLPKGYGEEEKPDYSVRCPYHTNVSRDCGPFCKLKSKAPFSKSKNVTLRRKLDSVCHETGSNKGVLNHELLKIFERTKTLEKGYEKALQFLEEKLLQQPLIIDIDFNVDTDAPNHLQIVAPVERSDGLSSPTIPPQSPVEDASEPVFQLDHTKELQSFKFEVMWKGEVKQVTRGYEYTPASATSYENLKKRPWLIPERGPTDNLDQASKKLVNDIKRLEDHFIYKDAHLSSIESDQLLLKDIQHSRNDLEQVEHTLSTSIARLQRQVATIQSTIEQICRTGRSFVVTDVDMLKKLQIHVQVLQEKIQRYTTTLAQVTENYKQDTIDEAMVESWIKEQRSQLKQLDETYE